MQFPVIDEDKANHFIYGQAIFAIAFIVLMQFASIATWARGLAVVVVLLAGLAKDYIYDRANRLERVTDPKDVLATVMGGVAAYALSLM